MPRVWSTLLLAPLLALPISVAGQDTGPSQAANGSPGAVQVIGAVVDRTTEEPVPLATVAFSLVSNPDQPVWSGVADSEGHFEVSRLPPGAYQIQVDALSFAQVTDVEILPGEAVLDVRIEMVPVEYELDPIVVVATRSTRLDRTGFYRRQQQGIGYFVDHAEIEARQALEVTDLFRRIPGARVQESIGLRGAMVGLRGGCTPQVVVDGAVLAGPVSLDQLAQPGDIEAIEVYHGPTAPIAYNARSGCGTIVMWTRSPPEATGKISFKKFLAIVGFATIAVVATN